jgi:co-chaperonin GroES (HSP10)
MTTTGLLLPERLAKKKALESKKAETAKLPTPTGWRILIMPYIPPRVSKGGIELPDEVHERERLAINVGLVMALGPLAYKDKSKFATSQDRGGGWTPWCKEKDWVLFGKYAGSRFKIDGGELRLLNDDEILAVIEDPSHLVHI